MQLTGRIQAPQLPSRLAQLAAGLFLYGVSIAVMLTANLGVDAWDVFHQGVASLTGASFGSVVVVVSVAVLLLWIPLRQWPGLGTVANAVVVGVVADLTLGVLTPQDGLPLQWLFLIAGITLNGAATGLYIGAGLGAGPRDGLMTGWARRSGRSIRSVRTAIELLVLAAGWALGGPVGIGTLAYAGLIGPLSQRFIDRFSRERELGGVGPSLRVECAT